MVNNYEAALVLSAKSPDAAAATLEKFKALISANGTLGEVDEWGSRKLAYPIDDEEEGIYCIVDFSSEPEFPAELDRVGKITEGVLRLMVTKK